MTSTNEAHHHAGYGAFSNHTTEKDSQTHHVSKPSSPGTGYYSFPMLSSRPSSSSQAASTQAAAAAAAASLTYLLSNPQQGDDKWHEHQQRVLDAILPPKGFDSVTVQLPPSAKYLNSSLTTTPARITTRRLPMVRASASVDNASRTASSTGTSPSPPSPSTATANHGNREARSPSRLSSTKRRQLNAGTGTFTKTEEQMAQAAAAAAIAVGNAAGTTGAIASAAAAAAALCQEEQESSRREARSAFTLLCVDDDVISCKIIAKICEKWGQPYETVTSGERAVELYKQAPEKYRCILMDMVMPGLDGLETTKMIRKFEEESWVEGPSASTETPSSTVKVEEDGKVAAATESRHPTPIRRAVVIGMAPRTAPTPAMEVIKEIGFDVVVEKPLHLRLLSELLFSGPETNAVALYGGVDKESLRQAGYPLRMKPLGGARRPPMDSVFGLPFC